MQQVSSYTIEQPTRSDYTELAEVWEASVRATHLFLREEDISFFRNLVRSEALLHAHLYCVRMPGRMIAGFMGVCRDKLEMLFIHPAAMGQGVGKALLYYAVQKLGVTQLEVNEQNVSALSFYQRQGFRVITRSDFDGLSKPYPVLTMLYQGD